MAYDRWAMDAATATALTGTTIVDADLEGAEDEIRELLGWAPQPSAYSTTVDDAGAPTDRRVWALGRAIAWQAAHRTATPAAADDQDSRVASESIGGGDYAVTYADGGTVEGGPIAARTRRLLAGNGWLARRHAGHTRP